MGALAKFNVAGQSTDYFKNMVPGLGSTPNSMEGFTKGVNQAMDLVRDHPLLAKAVAVAFPPAKAAIMAMEVGNQARDILGSDREKATQAFTKAGNKDGQSLLERMTGTARHLDRDRRQDRMIG